MQKLISKYGLAAHLALVAVAPLFLSPAAVIWLSVLGAVWLVMEPSRVGNEMLHEARRRVSRAIATDPLFWVTLLLVVIAVVRALNVGVEMAYDAETGKWFVASAAFALLPGSVEGCGFPLVGCAVAVLVSVQGCRHGLGRSARGAFALVASVLSGLGGLVWAFLCREGAVPVISAVDTPIFDPTFAGGAYGVFLACAVASLASAFESRWLKAMPFSFVAVSGNLMGLFLFSPPAVAVAYAAVALVVFAYSFAYVRIRLGRTEEFKFLVIVGIGVALALQMTIGFLPNRLVESRTAPILAGRLAPEGFFEVRAVLSDVAARVWKESPWLGTGLGAFPFDLQFAASPADWEVVTPFQKAVPNGYWTVLVERGVVGAFLLVLPLALLLFAYVKGLIAGVTRALPQPLAWTGLLLLPVAAAEMLFDNSFLAPGAAVALVSVFALSAAAFPKEKSSHG